MNKDLYLQGQLDLIENIKEKVAELEKSDLVGFDLVMDVISLLKSIKPINKQLSIFDEIKERENDYKDGNEKRTS